MATADEERARRITELVRGVEQIEDRESRERALQLMEAILELHGAAIERMLEIVLEAGETGDGVMRRFTTDNLVSNLLVLHNLHPEDPETRIQQALRRMHGSAELIGLFEGVARVRLTEEGCGLKESVAELIREAAPDIAEVIVEEALTQGRTHVNGFVPLAAIGVAVPRPI